MYDLARPRYGRSDYLALERVSDQKHEYVGGQILAMAGATPRHDLVASNVARALGNRLAGPCVVLPSDQRVTVEATGDSFYPDAVVVCGEWALDEDRRGVTNPAVVVEVLSPSTEDYDRLEKLPQYKTGAALRDALLVDHRARRVEHHKRLDAGRWLVSELTEQDALELAVGVEIPIAELFAKLDLVPE